MLLLFVNDEKNWVKVKYWLFVFCVDVVLSIHFITFSPNVIVVKLVTPPKIELCSAIWLLTNDILSKLIFNVVIEDELSDEKTFSPIISNDFGSVIVVNDLQSAKAK